MRRYVLACGHHVPYNGDPERNASGWYAPMHCLLCKRTRRVVSASFGNPILAAEPEKRLGLMLPDDEPIPF